MGEASAAAAEARATSAEVRRAASGIGEEAAVVGREVEQFVADLQSAGREQRRFERIAGRDWPVRLDLAGGGSLAGRLVDISRGGAGVLLDDVGAAQLAAGASIGLGLPDAAALVPMRVVRAEGLFVGLVARQEAGVASQLDLVMVALQAGRQAA
jgi:hypothetical protein